MLSAHNISFSYGSQPVLQNLSFFLAKGDRLLLLGPSGQGKTTFLRLLCGLLEPQNGKIQRPSRLGVVFQEDRLLPALTLEENLRLVNPDAALAQQVGEELGIFSLFSSLPSSLSGGQRRRGALARALLFPCDALLMDEPFQGLDEISRKQAAQCILNHQEGRAVLVISHEPKDAELLKAHPIHLKSLMA